MGIRRSRQPSVTLDVRQSFEDALAITRALSAPIAAIYAASRLIVWQICGPDS